jgi:hypothetical protein
MDSRSIGSDIEYEMTLRTGTPLKHTTDVMRLQSPESRVNSSAVKNRGLLRNTVDALR